MLTNVQLLRYLLAVYRELPGSWRQRCRTVTKMARSIRDYVSEGARPGYEQLVTRFGDPKQIASTYIMEMEADEIIDNIRCRKKIVNIILVTASIIALIYGVFIARVYASYERDANGYAVVEVIEVERKHID